MKDNTTIRWNTILIILPAIFATITLFVLYHNIPRNEHKSFEGWWYDEIRIGNAVPDKYGNVAKIAGMKYKQTSISDSDQDELWQHTILHKYFRHNDDTDSKYYGEHIWLSIYDISSDICKSNHTEAEYYADLANQIRASETLILSTDSTNNNIMLSSQTYIDGFNYDNSDFYKIIYILANERIYKFKFSQACVSCRYTKDNETLTAIDRRFMSIIDRIDFSSYQQWKDAEEKVKESLPYYRNICILSVLLGFLLSLLGIRLFLNNASTDKASTNTSKVICWILIIISLIECVIAIYCASYCDIITPLGIMLFHTIVVIPLYILAHHFKIKVKE